MSISCVIAADTSAREEAAEPWWMRATSLAETKPELDGATVQYRFGDALLELVSDSAALITELQDRYCECAVVSVVGRDVPRVRCSVCLCEDGRLALVRFNEPTHIDAFGIGLALLKHPVADPIFAELPSTGDWRLIGRTDTGVPVAAALGAQMLVECARSPTGFVADLIVNPVLATQRELLFVHAASVGVGHAGVLLIGPSGSGKTTTALAAAARGHAYFGDDVAAIRTASTQVVPFRSTASVRPGPHAAMLTRQLETGCWDPPHADGVRRLRMRVAEVFPRAAARPLPLRLALFLRRFAPVPAAEPFAPTPDALGSSWPLALNNALLLSWGTLPQRRLLQFILFLRMLGRIRCAWLDVGPPEATADLVETIVEKTWD